MRLAVYAGSFDPITRGHLSVIERSAELFDGLIVFVALNPEKTPLFSPAERLELIRDAIAGRSHVDCAAGEGLVVDFARQRGARYLVRGVRGVTDIEAEIQLANCNRALAPELDTVFIPAHPALSRVSSSGLKTLLSSGASISAYCTAAVEQRLREKYASNPGACRVEP